MWKKLLIFFLSFSLLFSQFSGFFVKPVFAVAQTYDMATSTNWNIRIDGAAAGDKLARCMNVVVKDIDADGKVDFLIGAERADNNSRTNSGSLYLIYGTLLENLSGKGLTLDLSNPANYNLRFDGAKADDRFGSSHVVSDDFDNDGKLDIVVHAVKEGLGGRTNSGALYVIYNKIFTNLSGTGNTVDLANSDNYSLRFYGGNSEYVASYINSADFDNDGKRDLVFGGVYTDYNGRYNSGSVYIFYNTLLQQLGAVSKDVDVTDINKFNIRIDGASVEELLTDTNISVVDINSDGKDDLMVGGVKGNKKSRLYGGTVYLLYNSLVSSKTGTGNILDLANPANYNLVFYGAAEERVAVPPEITGDLDGDGKNDLVIAGMNASYSFASSGSLYFFFSSFLSNYSGTGNEFDLTDSSKFNLRIDGSMAVSGLGLHYISSQDYNNDGDLDIITAACCESNSSRSYSGSLYILYNSLIRGYTGTGNHFTIGSSSNFSLRYDGKEAGSGFTGVDTIRIVDLNNDGNKDIVVAGDSYGYSADLQGRDRGSLYIIYNFPHTFSVNSVSPYTNTNTLGLKGTVSLSSNSVTSLSGVQYNLDSNSPSSGWTACSGTSSFTCSLTNLSSLSEGGHTVYLRAYDSNTSYTAQSSYSSVSFTYDKTSPVVEWTINQERRSFESQGEENGFTTENLPVFSFTKSNDTLSGIDKYQIILKEKDKEDRVYLDNINPEKPSDKDYRDEEEKYVKYEGDRIIVWGKKEEDKLIDGAYKWKVRTIDKAGNTRDTSEKILRINTHQANFSNTFFPLVLLSPELTGGEIVINTLTPTFYGITTVGTKVTLTLKQNDQTILEKQTIANDQSRFGINIDREDNLKTGEYQAFLSATNLQGDYIELPEFTLILSGSGRQPQVEGVNTGKPTLTPIPSKKVEKLSPTPIPSPIPQFTTQHQPEARHCFLFWCW